MLTGTGKINEIQCGKDYERRNGFLRNYDFINIKVQNFIWETHNINDRNSG